MSHCSHPVTDYGAREESENQPPPKFTHGLNSLQITEGSDAHFACKVEPASDSNLEIEWLRNGQPIAAGKLTILSVKTETFI